MKIVMIVGSMRKESFNLQLAKKAEAYLGGKAEVEYLDYQDVPFMNQDIEFPSPKEVQRVRDIVMDADGIWIFTPEYNYSYPGVLKNLLDWLSRPLIANDPERNSAVKGKKVAVSGAAGRSAASGARGKLKELLQAMRMELLEEETGVALSTSFATGVLALSKEDEEHLKMQAEAFVKMIG